jgi:HprK-related kinase A
MHEVILNTHPFSFRIHTNAPLVLNNLERIYGAERLNFSPNSNDFAHYNVSLVIERKLGRLWKPQAHFLCDEIEPFVPMDSDKAYAMLEWGLNWVVAAHEVNHAIVHAAVLAKEDKAVLLPAPPGSGKSTTCCAFMAHGWRLLSDELALITPNTLTVTPVVRPACLKNKSIEVVKGWLPNSVYSDIARNTHKGDVVHLSPSEHSWKHRYHDAVLTTVVMPTYNANTYCDITPLTQRQTFPQVFDNCFNVGILGQEGFSTLSHAADNLEGYQITFNNADEVVAFIEETHGFA